MCPFLVPQFPSVSSTRNCSLPGRFCAVHSHSRLETSQSLGVVGRKALPLVCNSFTTCLPKSKCQRLCPQSVVLLGDSRAFRRWGLQNSYITGSMT